MSKPTANRAIDALLGAGLVEEVPRPEDAVGYDAVYFGAAGEIDHVPERLRSRTVYGNIS